MINSLVSLGRVRQKIGTHLRQNFRMIHYHAQYINKQKEVDQRGSHYLHGNHLQFLWKSVVRLSEVANKDRTICETNDGRRESVPDERAHKPYRQVHAKR